MSLEGSKTHENLKAAFAGESQANRRYLYFARAADIEGYPEAAGVFKNTADGETGHAFGHLEFMEKGGAGDPGDTRPERGAEADGRDAAGGVAQAVGAVRDQPQDLRPPPARLWRRLVPPPEHGL